jgi:hypothetical protein
MLKESIVLIMADLSRLGIQKAREIRRRAAELEELGK